MFVHERVTVGPSVADIVLGLHSSSSDAVAAVSVFGLACIVGRVWAQRIM